MSVNYFRQNGVFYLKLNYFSVLKFSGGDSMKTARLLMAAALVVGMATFTGCGVTVRTPPPPYHVEVRPVVPFAGAVWVDGYYTYRHGKYVWVTGRYMKPPHAGAKWVPGHWQQHRRGWKWHKGYWK